MSEYQYYEFRALDTPLTKQQINELRSFSTRAEITPYSFTNTYNYGSFKGNPKIFLEKYFDTFLHVNNWGTHEFTLRLPIKGISKEILSAYCQKDCFSYTSTENHFILNFKSQVESEDDWSWEEGDAELWLSSLLPIRANLISGDYRSLYLGWLSCVQSNKLEEKNIEPLIPAGLNEMTPELKNLVDFLRIDNSLLEIAAKNSATLKDKKEQKEEIRDWIQSLSHSDRDNLLVEFVQDNTSIYEQPLIQNLKKKLNQNILSSQSNRTVGDLLKASGV